MGDEADYIINQMLDFEDLEPDEDDERGPFSKACKFCGVQNLFWDVDHHDATGYWRLREAGGPPWVPHRCTKVNDIPPMED